MPETYHREELRIALDTRHEAHYLPPPPQPGAKVLDVGCGSGQTLIALGDEDRVSFFGLDPDLGAVQAGKSLTKRVHFVCGRAERLPYRNAYFDQVIARVSLPYVRIVPALREIRRVLKTGGTVWLMLHSWSMRLSWLRNSSFKEKIFAGYIVPNSLLFHAFGVQVPFLGYQETFQTNWGMRRALKKCGFDEIAISRGKYFVITAVAC